MTVEVSMIIEAAISLIGIIVTAAISNSLTKFRIEQLEKKVDKHNNVIERVFKLEQRVDDIEKD